MASAPKHPPAWPAPRELNDGRWLAHGVVCYRVDVEGGHADAIIRSREYVSMPRVVLVTRRRGGTIAIYVDARASKDEMQRLSSMLTKHPKYVCDSSVSARSCDPTPAGWSALCLQRCTWKVALFWTAIGVAGLLALALCVGLIVWAVKAKSSAAPPFSPPPQAAPPSAPQAPPPRPFVGGRGSGRR